METRVKLKLKYYKSIIENFDNYKNEIIYIFKNFKYNEGNKRDKKKKIKKHFPTIIFEDVNKFIMKHENENHCSFSLLAGNIELQKQKILDTMIRRYNCVNVFDRKRLKEIIETEYEYKKLINEEIFSINTNKKGIEKYNKEEIRKKFPVYIRLDGEIMFDYIYDIWTENSHHYCDLINLKLCDRIFICCNHENKKYNIMFETSEKVEKLNISKINIENHIQNNYNNM